MTAKGQFAPDRDIFERQPWDTDLSWEGFLLFRGMEPGHRSVKRVAELVAKQRGIEFTESLYNSVLDWSAHTAWRSRVDMWDLHVDRERRKKLVQAAIDMRERHVKLGVGLQTLGSLGLQRQLEQASKGEKVLLSPSDIKALIDLGIRVEREAHGQPGSIVEERNRLSGEEERTSMLSLLGDREALDAARRLVARLKKKPIPREETE